MNRFQVGTVALCTLINMLDGFDVLVVAFTASSIASEWDLTATAVGTLLSAGLAGMMAGSLVLAPLADRFGRRPLVLVCLAVISVGMVLSGVSQTAGQLAATRVLTGLGIGGMLPSLNTIVAEFASLRARSFAVSVLQAGYPIGATLGGILAALLIGSFGWRSVYISAGAASACLVLVVWRRLPESLDFLLAQRAPDALQRVNALLVRLGRSPLDALPDVVPGSVEPRRGYPGLLSTPHLLYTTALFCLAFFVVMFSFYFVLSWTPKLLVEAGMSTAQGISGGIILNVGGVLGSLLLGFLSARFAIERMIAVYMLASACLMVMFAAADSFGLFMVTTAFLLGFFIFGAMVGLYAFAPHLYPVSSRAAGLGLAIGVGRCGAVVSPALAGILFDYGWARADGFAVFAAPLLVSLVAVLVLGARRGAFR